MHKKFIHEEEFYFDDCPICQAMKREDNDLDSITKAFEEALKLPGSYGGIRKPGESDADFMRRVAIENKLKYKW